MPHSANSMPPPDGGREVPSPQPIDAFLVGAAGATLPTELVWKHGMWIGPSAAVNYPNDGHDRLPSSPDNWWYAHRATVVIRALDRTPVWPRIIWDVGGGTGLMEPALRKSGWRTVLVEPVARAAERAVDRANLVIAGSLDDLSLPDSCVPAIGMFDVLEHLDDPVGVLRECARVLMPGGILVATVPSHQWLWSEIDRVAGHQLRYSPKILARQAELAGLRLVETRHFFVALVPGAAAMRLVRRRSTDELAVLEREAAMLNPPPKVARLLRGLAAADRLTSGRLRSPVGLSLLGVLRKRA